jgi:hypothetical protein
MGAGATSPANVAKFISNVGAKIAPHPTPLQPAEGTGARKGRRSRNRSSIYAAS